MKKTLFIIFLALLMWSPQGVSAQELIFEGTLDLPTLKKGITFGKKENCRLKIPPSALTRQGKIAIASTSPGIVQPPVLWEFTGAGLSYAFEKVSEQDIATPLTIVCAPRTNEHVSLFYLDTQAGQWKPLHTSKKNGLLSATLFSSSASVIVLRRTAWVTADTFSSADLPAQSLVVLDDGGRVVYAKNEKQSWALASITKLMTVLVFLDHNPGLQKKMTIKKSDDSQPAKIPLRVGDRITVKDMFYTTLVGSRNNAANVLARSTGLSKEAFLSAMNEKAKKIGMTHTRFVDFSGLDPKNVSTALDTSKLARLAFAQQAIRAALEEQEYIVRVSNRKAKYTIKNTNPFLVQQSIVKEGKTGFINEAGYNFAVRGSEQGADVIAVVFGAPDSKTRFDVAHDLVAASLSRSRK